MISHVNKDPVLKDKKNIEKMKKEKKEKDKLNKNLKKMKDVDYTVTCSKTKPLSTVMKSKIMTKHSLVMMMNKEGGFKNKFMQERELESIKLY